MCMCEYLSISPFTLFCNQRTIWSNCNTNKMSNSMNAEFADRSPETLSNEASLKNSLDLEPKLRYEFSYKKKKTEKYMDLLKLQIE